MLEELAILVFFKTVGLMVLVVPFILFLWIAGKRYGAKNKARLAELDREYEEWRERIEAGEDLPGASFGETKAILENKHAWRTKEQWKRERAGISAINA